jgi:hypothetical protein
VSYVWTQLVARTTFTYKDSFIGTHISLLEAVNFTLYNFYSPGHPKSLASLLDDFGPSLPCILLGDFMLTMNGGTGN